MTDLHDINTGAAQMGKVEKKLLGSSLKQQISSEGGVRRAEAIYMTD